MSELIIQINSFGYQKSGIPLDNTGNNGGYVFDCRALPNPGRLPEFQYKTGIDDCVIDYLSKYKVVQKFINACLELVNISISSYTDRKFTNLSISFGCTGGQHRSVYCAEKLAQILKEKKINIHLSHMDIPTFSGN